MRSTLLRFEVGNREEYLGGGFEEEGCEADWNIIGQGKAAGLGVGGRGAGEGDLCDRVGGVTREGSRVGGEGGLG